MEYASYLGANTSGEKNIAFLSSDGLSIATTTATYHIFICF